MRLDLSRSPKHTKSKFIWIIQILLRTQVVLVEHTTNSCPTMKVHTRIEDNQHIYNGYSSISHHSVQLSTTLIALITLKYQNELCTTPHTCGPFRPCRFSQLATSYSPGIDHLSRIRYWHQTTVIITGT